MTVSLDGYLEPQRLSFGSPPGSELLPRILSLDESFPVFSPPPYEVSELTIIDKNYVFKINLNRMIKNPIQSIQIHWFQPQLDQDN